MHTLIQATKCGANQLANMCCISSPQNASSISCATSHVFPNALITVMQASMFSHFTIRHSQHMCHAAEPEHDEHKNTCHFFIFGLLFWGSHCFICAPIPSCFVNCFLCFQKGWLNKGLQTHTFNATVQCTHVHEMSIIQQSS